MEVKDVQLPVMLAEGVYVTADIAAAAMTWTAKYSAVEAAEVLVKITAPPRNSDRLCIRISC
jgi:hypothetical protein